MTDELPPLGVAVPSRRAIEAAETLLRGFHLQDVRESHLADCEVERAAAAAGRATSLMAAAFRFEFPDVPARRAGHAGELFMRALFLQDEIENWAAFRRCFADGVPPSVLVTGTERVPETNVDADPRWRDVETLLRSVCIELDVDPEFATLQTRFWRLHGQRRRGWRTTARRAHRIKLRRMVPTADPETIDDLAAYFVAGVERHDTWLRADPDDDVRSVVELVARYYHRIFELRGE